MKKRKVYIGENAKPTQARSRLRRKLRLGITYTLTITNFYPIELGKFLNEWGESITPPKPGYPDVEVYDVSHLVVKSEVVSESLESASKGEEPEPFDRSRCFTIPFEFKTCPSDSEQDKPKDYVITQPKPHTSDDLELMYPMDIKPLKFD